MKILPNDFAYLPDDLAPFLARKIWNPDSDAAKLIGKENVSKAKLESWNEYHEEDEEFVYIHEFEIVDWQK